MPRSCASTETVEELRENNLNDFQVEKKIHGVVELTNSIVR